MYTNNTHYSQSNLNIPAPPYSGGGNIEPNYEYFQNKGNINHDDLYGNIVGGDDRNFNNPYKNKEEFYFGGDKNNLGSDIYMNPNLQQQFFDP